MTSVLRKVVVFVVGVVGFASAVLAIYQWLDAPADLGEIRFVKSTDDRPYILGKDPATSAVIKDHVIVVGHIRVPDEFVLIGNRLDFEDGSALVGSPEARFIVVANQINGGRIIADGQDAKLPEGTASAGAAGGDGGQVTIVAVRANGLAVSAVGGRGGDGAAGADGRNGRGGRCDGFGRWRKAEPGDNGQDGGAAGAGGAGGVVTLYGPIQSSIDPSVRRGEAGKPGVPGRGGAGGRGCTGIGGSQASRADGRSGRPGAAAVESAVREGAVYRPTLDLSAISERLGALADQGEISYQAVNDLLKAAGEDGHD